MYGVYVHIPWCRIRCPYCNFNVHPLGKEMAPQQRYGEAVVREWQLRAPLFSGGASSLFFGGGTPSVATLEVLQDIIRAVDPAANAELSLEANPEDVGEESVARWLSIGLNRLSLGVQSFDPVIGRRLGRTRTARAAAGAIANGRRFPSLSVDLIFGVEGQTVEGFREELLRTIEAGADHVSLYGLTIEEGTAFGRARMADVEEDRWADLYLCAVETLGAAGIRRYEVSNFAREGHRSVHNEHYWRGRHWAGLGAGAHGYGPDGVRTVNLADPLAYREADDPTASRERPSGMALATELLWSTLRHVDGVERESFREKTGFMLEVPVRLDPWIFSTPERVVLKPGGFLLADLLTRKLLDSLVYPDPPP